MVNIEHSCNHLEEILQYEINRVMEEFKQKSIIMNEENLIDYLKVHAKQYREMYCGKICLYRKDCDANYNQKEQHET